MPEALTVAGKTGNMKGVESADSLGSGAAD